MSAPSTVAAGARSEVFPDLHHKMSKKIAQLTKVIYHLNTRNEDNQAEMDALNAFHQSEMQQVVRDAATKIAKFKEFVDSRQSQANIEAKMEKMLKKHDEEKANAVREMMTMKVKYESRETKITREYQLKFENVSSELESINKKFGDKVDSFERINRELKTALDAATSAGSQGMKEIIAKHEKELAELVRVSNEKYQNMLIEQLQLQEAARAETAQRVEEARAAVTATMRAEMDRALGHQHAELTGDKQEALVRLRHEYDIMLKTQQEEATSKLDLVSAEIKRKTDEYGMLLLEKVRGEEDFERRLQELQQQLNAALGDSSSQQAQLNDRLQHLSEEAKSQRAKLAEREEEITRLKNLLDKNSAQSVEMQQELATLKELVKRLQKEIADAGGATAATEKDLRMKLERTEEEMGRLKSTVISQSTEIGRLNDTLKALRDEAKVIEQEHHKALAAVQAEKAVLQRQLDTLSSSNKSALEVAQNELNALKQQYADREAQFSRDRGELEEGYRKRLEQSIENERQITDNLGKAKSDFEGQLRQLQLQMEEDAKANRQRLQAELDALRQSHQAAVDSLVAEHQAAQDALKASIASLESQLEDVTRQADGEKNALKAEVLKYENKTKALQKELDAKKKESERAETVVNGLKNQVESLREELKASQAAFREKMDSSRAKIDADWQAKMDSLLSDHEMALKDLEELLKRAHQSELDALCASHEEEVLTLKSALQKEASEASTELARAEQERLRLVKELSEEKEGREREVADLKASAAADVKDREDRHKREVDSLRKELFGSSELKEKRLRDEHAQNIVDLQNKHETALEELANKFKIDLDCKLSAQNQQHIDEKLAVCAKIEEANKSKLESLQSAHEEAVKRAATDADAIAASLNGQISKLTADLSAVNQKVLNLEETITRANADRVTREEKNNADREQLVRDHQVQLRMEKESGQIRLMESEDRARGEIKALSDDFNVQKHILNEDKENLLQELATMQLKWQNREIRPEDLERIRELETEMVDKDHLVKKTRDEMMYFKREMLNREESYNQKFGNSPVVGVMQVVKPKDAKSKSSKPGSGK